MLQARVGGAARQKELGPTGRAPDENLTPQRGDIHERTVRIREPGLQKLGAKEQPAGLRGVVAQRAGARAKAVEVNPHAADAAAALGGR